MTRLDVGNVGGEWMTGCCEMFALWMVIGEIGLTDFGVRMERRRSRCFIYRRLGVVVSCVVRVSFFLVMAFHILYGRAGSGDARRSGSCPLWGWCEIGRAPFCHFEFWRVFTFATSWRRWFLRGIWFAPPWLLGFWREIKFELRWDEDTNWCLIGVTSCWIASFGSQSRFTSSLVAIWGSLGLVTSRIDGWLRHRCTQFLTRFNWILTRFWKISNRFSCWWWWADPQAKLHLPHSNLNNRSTHASVWTKWGDTLGAHSKGKTHGTYVSG